MHPKLYLMATNLLKRRGLMLPNPSQAKWARSSLKHHKELRAQLAKPRNRVETIPLGGTSCYDPSNFSHLPYPSLDTPQVVIHDLKTTTKPLVIFPSASPPELMGKAPLPLNPPPLPSLEDLPPRPATPEQTIPAEPQWTNPSQVIMA